MPLTERLIHARCAQKDFFEKLKRKGKAFSAFLLLPGQDGSLEGEIDEICAAVIGIDIAVRMGETVDAETAGHDVECVVGNIVERAGDRRGGRGKAAVQIVGVVMPVKALPSEDMSSTALGVKPREMVRCSAPLPL